MDIKENEKNETIIDKNKIKKKKIPSVFVLFYRANENQPWRLFPHSMDNPERLIKKYKMFISAKFTYMADIKPE